MCGYYSTNEIVSKNVFIALQTRDCNIFGSAGRDWLIARKSGSFWKEAGDFLGQRPFPRAKSGAERLWEVSCGKARREITVNGRKNITDQGRNRSFLDQYIRRNNVRHGNFYEISPAVSANGEKGTHSAKVHENRSDSFGMRESLITIVQFLLKTKFQVFASRLLRNFDDHQLYFIGLTADARQSYIHYRF